MTPKDIAEFISDLIDSHIWTVEQNNQRSEDKEPHISIIDRSANIKVNSWTDDGEIMLSLNDGQGAFNITIEKVADR